MGLNPSTLPFWPKDCKGRRRWGAQPDRVAGAPLPRFVTNETFPYVADSHLTVALNLPPEPRSWATSDLLTFPLYTAFSRLGRNGGRGGDQWSPKSPVSKNDPPFISCKYCDPRKNWIFSFCKFNIWYVEKWNKETEKYERDIQLHPALQLFTNVS